jgi:hypothetical protein
MAQSVARIFGSSDLTFDTIAFCGALGMGAVSIITEPMSLVASAANMLMAISRDHRRNRLAEIVEVDF